MKSKIRNMFIILSLIVGVLILTQNAIYAAKNTIKVDKDLKIIGYIAPQTTVDELKNTLGVDKIYKDNKLTKQATSGYVGSGMYIKNGIDIYELSVIGDFDGDGKAQEKELENIIKYIIGKKGLEGKEYISADINGDGKVDQRDVTKFIRYEVHKELDLVEREEDPSEIFAEKIQVEKSTEGYTNEDIEITAKITDEAQKMEYYVFTQNENPEDEELEWETISKTKTEITKKYKVEENGTYYFYVKDIDGKIYTRRVEVNNIDKTNVNITNTKAEEIKFYKYGVTTQTEDEESGIAKIVVHYKKQGDTEEKTEEVNYEEINSENKGKLEQFEEIINIENLEKLSKYTIYVEVYDVAGNKETSEEMEITTKIVVAKIGDKEYETLQEAIDAAEDNVETIIELQEDIEENIVIPAGKNIILRLNGHTIKAKDESKPTITIEKGGKLTIEGEGKVTSENGIAIENNGTLNINGGEISSENGTAIVNNGILNINGGKVTSKNGTAIINYGTLNINGGEISTENGTAIENYGIINKKGGKIDPGKGKGIVNHDGIINLNDEDDDEIKDKSIEIEEEDIIFTTTQEKQWVNQDKETTIEVDEEIDIGNFELQYSKDNSNWTKYENALISEENETIYARLINIHTKAVKVTSSKEIIKIDKTATSAETKWKNIKTNGFELITTVEDSESGLASITWYYKKQGAEEYTEVGTKVYKEKNSEERGITEEVSKSNTEVCEITGLEQGRYVAYAKVTDVAGNEMQTEEITIELTAMPFSIGSILSQTEWSETEAKLTATFLTNNDFDIEVTKTPEDESSWVVSNSIETESKEPVYARLTDGTNHTLDYVTVEKTLVYNIVYDYNEGTAGEKNPETAEYDEQVEISNPTREDYDFVGWKASNLSIDTACYQEEGKEELTNWMDEETLVTGLKGKNLRNTNGSTITLTAQWRISKRTITYNANGGSGTMAADEAKLGDTYSVKSNSFTAPSGYSFSGWATADTSHTSVSSFTVTDDTTLYAIWGCNGTGYTCAGGSYTCTDGYTYECSGVSYYTCPGGSHVLPAIYCPSCGKGQNWNNTTGGSCFFCGAWCPGSSWQDVPCQHGQMSSHSAKTNCEHGYTGAHTVYQRCSHGYTSAHTVTAYCSHGYANSHSYCSHGNTSTHYYK